MNEALPSLLLTCSLLLGTPGPATLALAATGATYGFSRGLPFLSGILLGLSVAITGAAIGLANLFALFPNVRMLMQFIGAMYICYIAWKIATAPVLDPESSALIAAPRFADGFILNLLNVKAYAAFLAIFSQFLLPLGSDLSSYFFTGLVCFLMATAIDVLWLWFGSAISPLFQRPREARLLRVTFAVLMISAVTWVFIR